jgi:hypothetical protein
MRDKRLGEPAESVPCSILDLDFRELLYEALG